MRSTTVIGLCAATLVACSGSSGGNATLTGPGAFSVTYTLTVVGVADGGITTFLGAFASADETGFQATYIADHCTGTSGATAFNDGTAVSVAASAVNNAAMTTGTAYPSSNIYIDQVFADGGVTRLESSTQTPQGSVTFTTVSTSQVAGSFTATMIGEDGGSAGTLSGTFSSTPLVCP